MPDRILIMEDDANIRLGLRDALEAEGYEVSELSDGVRALDRIRAASPDLIVLDVMLPGRNGFEICRDLRAAKIWTPVLMLTAKSQEQDKVVGLRLGADDYLTKPFGMQELLARVDALLRRTRQPMESAAPLPEELRFGEVTVRCAALRGRRGEVEFELSPRELAVLALLHARSGDVVSRNDLMQHAWGREYRGTTRTVDQVIVKLRRKIEDDPGAPRHLLTVHGAGYRFEP